MRPVAKNLKWPKGLPLDVPQLDWILAVGGLCRNWSGTGGAWGDPSVWGRRWIL